MTAPDTNTPGNGLTDADLLALAGECGARLARSLPVSLSEPQKVVDIQFLPAQFFSFARAIEAKIRAADRAADREARPAPATSNDTDTMAWQRQGVTLTAHQLAEAIMLASGETVTFSDPDMADSEVTIAYAPEGFVRDDDGKTEPAGYVAWLTDYPEEGCIPLTDPLAERAKEAFSTLAASTPPADRCRHGVRFPHECTECQEDTPPASEARATGDAAGDRCRHGVRFPHECSECQEDVPADCETAAWKPGEWFQAASVDDMQAFFRARLPAIREAAREHGYAIGVHGSERRDFDLMAMPWREGASDAETLARAVAIAACGITRSGPYEWEAKPLGRIATSIPICWTPPRDVLSDGHIDLSIMPGVAATGAAGEPQPAEHVGDTRFEGWLSCHEPDRTDGRRCAYTKQDMRKSYWAGYTERSTLAAVPQADSGAAGERCPQCPHPSACQVHDECLKRSAGGQGDKP